MKLLLFILLIVTFNANSFSFSKSTYLLKKIYKEHPKTFYCDCDIQWVSKKLLKPSVKSCGYVPRNEYTRKGNINKRAERIEWEHVVPAWEFGHQLQCWQNGGRKNCSKTSNKFKLMERDLHNLVPAIGEINADRSNYKFGFVDKKLRAYGSCDVEVDFKSRVFEPKEDIRGNIARIYLYFELQYGLKISKKQKQLYNAWNKLDPVDELECKIHGMKALYQGNVNPFFSKRCIY